MAVALAAQLDDKRHHLTLVSLVEGRSWRVHPPAERPGFFEFGREVRRLRKDAPASIMLLKAPEPTTGGH